MLPTGLSGRSTPDELGTYFDEIAQMLTDHGIPTLLTAAVRELVDALFEDVAALSPELRSRLELDTKREPIGDDLEEHSRERIVLHDTGPLPLEVVPMAEIGKRAADFARAHEQREAGPPGVVPPAVASQRCWGPGRYGPRGSLSSISTRSSVCPGALGAGRASALTVNISGSAKTGSPPGRRVKATRP